MHPSPYRRRLSRWLAPIRWLTRLHPLTSWLVVMGVIVGLSLLRLRWLALLVAVSWTAYAIYTWIAPARRWPRRR
ncbi:MAG TPA: hypothetical protein VIL37_01495 [Natronosporangium sp.]